MASTPLAATSAKVSLEEIEKRRPTMLGSMTPDQLQTRDGIVKQILSAIFTYKDQWDTLPDNVKNSINSIFEKYDDKELKMINSATQKAYQNSARNMREADRDLENLIKKAKEEYGYSGKEGDELIKALMELQIKILLLRCSELGKKTDISLFKELLDVLKNKASALTSLVDIKHNELYVPSAPAAETVAKGGMFGGSSTYYPKYIKYKSKYMSLRKN